MTPDEAQAVLWGVFAALGLYCWWEWNSICEARNPEKAGCLKHPSVDRCRCRGNLPPGKR